MFVFLKKLTLNVVVVVVVVVVVAAAVVLHLNIKKWENSNLVKSGFNSYRRTTLAKPYALEFCENENNFDDSFFKTTKDNPGKTMHIRIL